jgi:fatty acid desaturase
MPFPMGKRAFLAALVKQLWLPNLFRFIIIRAKYNATGTDKNPYLKKGWKPSKLPVRVGIVYMFSLVGILAGLTLHGDPLLLAVVPAVLWAAMMAFYAFLPAAKFHHSRVHPVISMRWMTFLRVSYITVVFNALAWLTLLTGHHAWIYYAVYWLVPIFTSFSFFMILRQLVQHGNGDRGWLTNTRTFFVARFINFSVFPIGQDYHLPHHIYASVPHYRLKQLHEALLEYPEYRQHALEVHGYFLSPEHPQLHPTVLDVVGAEYAAHEFRGVHIDNSVLEDDEVEEKDAILKEGADEAQRLAEQGRPTTPNAQLAGS